MGRLVLTTAGEYSARYGECLGRWKRAIRGKVRHQAFHGATELIRVECGNGLVLVVRTPGSGGALDDVELEFSPTDAVLVRESPERI
jgi:hypothetical protein